MFIADNELSAVSKLLDSYGIERRDIREEGKMRDLYSFFGGACAALAVSAFVPAFAVSVHANEMVGEVYATDIGALIDDQPIRSYNFQDYTYVIAEDLRGYGFAVDWDADARTLTVTQNTDTVRTSLAPSEINIKKSDIQLGRTLYNVYSTDIRTYLHGTEIAACNIDGQTLIKLSDLRPFGEVVFDEEHRLAKLNVIRSSVEYAYNEQSYAQTLSLGDGITYTGEAENGVPHGIGRIHDTSVMTEFPGTVNDMVYTGSFVNGEKTGYFIDEGYYTYTIGSDLGTYYRSTYGNKYDMTGGMRSDRCIPGFVHQYSDYHGMKYYIDEYMTENGALGFFRQANVDYEYLYGMKVTRYTTYTNGDLNVAVRGDAPVFEKFGASAYSPLSVIDADGALYSVPETYDNCSNAVYRRRNLIDGNYYEGWLLAKDGKLYLVNDNNESNDTFTAENVISANEGHYIDQNGGLYEMTVDGRWELIDSGVKQVSGSEYVIYLKNDGSVWTYRSENFSGEWSDEADHSEPVLMGENAVYVSSGEGSVYAYIDGSGILWGFGSSYDGQLGYAETFDYDSYEYTKALSNHTDPVKLGEGFVSVKAGSTMLAKKEDGSLWGWGSNESGQIVKDGEKYILKPVKIADNVKDYAFSYGAVYIIKNDGSLWYWGKTYINKEEYKEPVRCEKVYDEIDWGLEQY